MQVPFFHHRGQPRLNTLRIQLFSAIRAPMAGAALPRFGGGGPSQAIRPVSSATHNRESRPSSSLQCTGITVYTTRPPEQQGGALAWPLLAPRGAES